MVYDQRHQGIHATIVTCLRRYTRPRDTHILCLAIYDNDGLLISARPLNMRVKGLLFEQYLSRLCHHHRQHVWSSIQRTRSVTAVYLPATSTVVASPASRAFSSIRSSTFPSLSSN